MTQRNRGELSLGGRAFLWTDEGGKGGRRRTGGKGVVHGRGKTTYASVYQERNGNSLSGEEVW